MLVFESENETVVVVGGEVVLDVNHEPKVEVIGAADGVLFVNGTAYGAGDLAE